MVLNKQKQQELAAKLQRARLSLIQKHPFYGILLLDLKFSLAPGSETCYADGERIAFDPEFLDKTSPSETEFLIIHELCHHFFGHVFRGEGYDHEIFNVAADIVINANILRANKGDLSSITVLGKESMHRLPGKDDCWNYSAEELYPQVFELMNGKKPLKYEDLTSKKGKGKPNKDKDFGGDSDEDGNEASDKYEDEIKPVDNHDHWKETVDPLQKEIWLDRMIKATDLVSNMVAGGEIKACGDIPAFLERMIKELRDSKLDWKTLLQNYLQDCLYCCDYSYCPPDRRFSDYDYFIPDLNVKDQEVSNILFFVDTSGSIDQKALDEAFSEIKGAIDQFDGKLSGNLAFFDAKVYDPVPFDSVADILEIKPQGGGGTDFSAVFKYVERHMDEEKISAIIILTDGLCRYPDKSAANGKDVLWVINNGDEKHTPPWGDCIWMK